MKRVGEWVAIVAGLGAVGIASTHLHGVRAAEQSTVASCCTVAGADFPKVGGNYGNQNNSSLARIDRTNVARLGGAWHLNLEGGPAAAATGPAAPPPEDEGAVGGRGGRGGRGGAPGGGPGGGAGSQQSSAIAVGGVLYIETSQGNVYAVDGKSGQTKWAYKSGAGTQFRRGVAVAEGKVFTATAGKKVVALDQNTGAVIWTKTVGEDDGSRGSLKTAITYYDGMIFFGVADASRGVGFAFNAKDGSEVWRFYGPANKGEFGGDTWEGDTAKSGGASPWMHPAIDPELGLVYWTFGNARAGGATDGSTRGGQNLFANSIVAINAKTGKRVWHFQSVHHDIWDMDNVMAPVLADVPVNGRIRKIVVYGSKTGMYYVLDRVDGSPITPIDEKPMPQEPAQKTWPTQPIPRGDSVIPICPNTDLTNRVPPNYKSGCLFTPHTDDAVVQSPGTGGGMTWNALSFDPRTRLIYTGVGIVNSGHVQRDGGVGFRPLGEERSGRIVAFDPATHKIVWSKNTVWALAHGNGILTTAGGLMFIGQPDGVLLALDIRDGRQLWQWQTGAGVHTSPLTYEIDGEQYVAIFAGGNGLPYNSPRGDDFWAFKLGGAVKPAATPVPPPMRQPITATAVEGASIANTVTIARNWSAGKVSADEATSPNSMAPQHLRVPVGTKVTFINPTGNAQPHCVTQFYEKLFASPKLAPGQSYSYTFAKAGEYFYNDCTSPRTTGKIVVYAPTVIRVTSTNNDGAGSLRQAILSANAIDGTKTIEINIAGVGPHVIKPTGQFLPPLLKPAIVRLAKAGAPGTFPVVLDGSLLVKPRTPTECPGATATYNTTSNLWEYTRKMGDGPNVRGYYGAGLSVYETGNVEISGLEIRNFCIGVGTVRAHDVNVHDMKIVDSHGAAGVIFTGDDGDAGSTALSFNNRLANSLLLDNGDGFEFTRGTHDSVLQGNIIKLTQPLPVDGNAVEYASSGNHNSLIDNTFSKYKDTSVTVGGGTDHVIRGNKFIDNLGPALRVGGQRAVIENNTFTGNAGPAISASGTGTKIINNVISGNAAQGIVIGGAGGGRGGPPADAARGGAAGDTARAGGAARGGAAGDPAQGGRAGRGNAAGDPAPGGRAARGGAAGDAAPAGPLVITISRNRIFNNGNLGIDVAPPGVNPADPAGAQGALDSNSSWSSASLTLNAAVTGRPGESYVVEFFGSGAADTHPAAEHGYGEGEVYLGTAAAKIDASGKAVIALKVPGADPLGKLRVQGVFSITVTDAAGQTSEFSRALPLTRGK